MRLLVLIVCMFGQVSFASVPQMLVPNEADVLAAFSTNQAVVLAVQALHEQGFSAIDTSVVSVSEGTFLVSTYLERRALPKGEPQNLIAVVVYRKNKCIVRLLRPDAVRAALLGLAADPLN